MYVRITPEERELIAEEARLLGITNAKGEGKIAPFVRWSAVYTANALRKERENGQNPHTANRESS
jgi:hypothetical protein